jgi:dihydrodipicolinate synthase/N-acetylneuraminate lyase
MKRRLLSLEDLTASVIAVPPLPRRADFSIDEKQTASILRHLRSGGVHTFMFGGNANLYNMSPSEFARFLKLLQGLSEEGDWFIPSIGSDFGKARDQIDLLRDSDFPTAMVLPHGSLTAPAGVATGLYRLAEAFRRPLIAYVKGDAFIGAADLARLFKDGALFALKYAVVRENPSEDAFLEDLLTCIDPARVISGIGERPAPVHYSKFGLHSFTSGSVCIAPHLSTSLLKALTRGDVYRAEQIRRLFLPLEDLRDAHSPIQVLHAAVDLAGIAATGPLLPFMASINDSQLLEFIKKAAIELLAANRAHALRTSAESSTAVQAGLIAPQSTIGTIR